MRTRTRIWFGRSSLDRSASVSIRGTLSRTICTRRCSRTSHVSEIWHTRPKSLLMWHSQRKKWTTFTWRIQTHRKGKRKSNKYWASKQKGESSLERFQSCFGPNFVNSKNSMSTKGSKMERTVPMTKVATSLSTGRRRSLLRRSAWPIIRWTSSQESNHLNTLGSQKFAHKPKTRTDRHSCSQSRSNLVEERTRLNKCKRLRTREIFRAFTAPFRWYVSQYHS